MNLFSVDGPLFKFMRTLLDVLIINVCWVICSLPIITIGPATVAAYSVTLRMIDETEGYVGRQFFKEFKKNFKNGLPLGIIFLIAMYSMYLDIQLLLTGIEPFIILSMTLIAGYVYMSLFLYCFALSARYENSFIGTLKNSNRIFIRYFLRSMAIVLVVAVEIVIFTWQPVTLFLFALIGPASIFLTVSGMALPIFRLIERDEGVVETKKKNDDAVFEDHPDTDDITRKAHMNFKK